MRSVVTRRAGFLLSFLALSGLLLVGWALAADHNDPNAVNSIFSDVDVSAADLYDLFGFPSDDQAGGEKVVVALTFASVPRAGVFDTTCSTASASIPTSASRAHRGKITIWARCSSTSRQ